MIKIRDLVLCIVLLQILNSVAIGKVGGSKNYVPGKIVFKVRESLNKSVVGDDIINQMSSLRITNPVRVFEDVRDKSSPGFASIRNIYIADIDESSDIDEAIRILKRSPSIEYAEPVYLDVIDFIPNDPLYASQFYLKQIKAEQAWDLGTGNNQVVIGIIDTGVDWDHEDLQSAIWQNDDEIPENSLDDDNNGFTDDVIGWDFVSGVQASSEFAGADGNDDLDIEDNNPSDYNGHGTHVAGIAGAVTNNSLGISSVASSVKIMPLRCGYSLNDKRGAVRSDWIARALLYAADNGAVITNISSGTTGQLVVDAAFYAFQQGVLIVESAGNSNLTEPSALGGQDWVISVGAINENDIKTSYSNYGEYVDIMAPGGSGSLGILSTVPYPSTLYNNQKYAQKTGTSMSAPIVASCAALVKSHLPEMSVIDLFTRIVASADDIYAVNANYVNMLGKGRINVNKALTDFTEPLPDFSAGINRVSDETGNNNGLIDPGEKFNLVIDIKNDWADAGPINIEIDSETPWPVTIIEKNKSLPGLPGILDYANSTKQIFFQMECDSNAFPSMLKFYLNISSGDVNKTIPLMLSISPNVLLVADFEEANNSTLDFSDIYINSLDNSGIVFDYTHNLLSTIDADKLNRYHSVVWGCEWNFPTIDAGDRIAISSFLDNGGNLFISGPEIGWELNESTLNADEPFFRNYLKARYIADDAEQNVVYGVNDDPISNELSIDFMQKYRSIADQYPDVIEPVGNAVSIFNYNNGTSGAIRYDGDYKLVYFAFGGFESINDSIKRNTMMSNIFNWFNGINIYTEPLKDVEENNIDYRIEAEISSVNSDIKKTFLYWKLNSSFVFNKVAMTVESDNKYFALIPRQDFNTQISYFIYAEDYAGNYFMSPEYLFNIQDDHTLPEIRLLNSPLRSPNIGRFGPSPYEFVVMADDNQGINIDRVNINVAVNSSGFIEYNLLPLDDSLFKGTFEFESPLKKGDEVKYFFSAEDISNARNTSVTDTFYYMIDTTQVLDDFEYGLSDWSLYGDWSISEINTHTGQYSLTVSLPVNSNNTASFLKPLHLKLYKQAELSFYLMIPKMIENYTLFGEVNRIGSDQWETVYSYSGQTPDYAKQVIDLSHFCDSDLYFRFRTETFQSNSGSNLFIDDLKVAVSAKDPTGIINGNLIPQSFSVSQNFPNPFNPSTTFRIALPTESIVEVCVYNTIGELVYRTEPSGLNAGFHNIVMQPGELSSGVYFCRINRTTGNKLADSQVIKMLYLK